MSYIVKEDLPNVCGCCPLFDDEAFGSYKCYRVKNWGGQTTRASDCPLIELPQSHGPLIDKALLLKRLDESGNYISPAIRAYIETAEVLVDAEDSASLENQTRKLVKSADCDICENYQRCGMTDMECWCYHEQLVKGKQ